MVGTQVIGGVLLKVTVAQLWGHQNRNRLAVDFHLNRREILKLLSVFHGQLEDKVLPWRHAHFGGRRFYQLTPRLRAEEEGMRNPKMHNEIAWEGSSEA